MKVSDRYLDRLRIEVLRDKKGGSLFGLLLMQLDLVFDESCKTACVSHKKISLNPDFLQSLKTESQVTLMVHELQHVARMHMSRRKGRKFLVWNYACDFVINNSLIRDGYDFTGLENGCIDFRFDGMTEEAVYDILMSEGWDKKIPPGLNPDMEPEEDDHSKWDVRATQNALMRGGTAGQGMGGLTTRGIGELIERLTTPQVDWRRVLRNKLLDYGDEIRSYSRRSRRSSEIILPGISRNPEGELISFTAYIDTSGSVSTAMSNQIVTELHALKMQYPEVLIRLVQFDTQIHRDYTITSANELINTEIVGRGGTDLQCVIDDIKEKRPNFSIIFSDLRVSPVDLSKVTSELIWIIIGMHELFHPEKGSKWRIESI